MNIKNILIVIGEPYSIFSELIGRFFTKFKPQKKIIIIGNYSLLNKQLKKLKYNINLKTVKNFHFAKKDYLNVINVDFKYEKIFDKISQNSNKLISSSFKKSLEILNDNSSNSVLINGPISKKTFLKKKFLGVTEYLSNKTNSRNQVMLIYNDKISVSPITTHIPLKDVSKNINKKKILNNVIIINDFFKNRLKKRAKFAVLGLNPHCESVERYSEEDKIIIPSIRRLKRKGIDIDGPFAADTFFLKKNINKYNIVIGMYHDQVLTPLKTLYNFNAINITLGLPFVRISPDHGPNSLMLGKNKSDPSSFFYAMKFISKLK